MDKNLPKEEIEVPVKEPKIEKLPKRDYEVDRPDFEHDEDYSPDPNPRMVPWTPAPDPGAPPKDERPSDA